MQDNSELLDAKTHTCIQTYTHDYLYMQIYTQTHKYKCIQTCKQIYTYGHGGEVEQCLRPVVYCSPLVKLCRKIIEKHRKKISIFFYIFLIFSVSFYSLMIT